MILVAFCVYKKALVEFPSPTDCPAGPKDFQLREDSERRSGRGGVGKPPKKTMC